MKIGIIGAGRVGTTLGKYLSLAGICVTGYYSRTEESVDKAATFTGTAVYQDLEELAAASDTLFLTTPDNEVGKVWREVSRFPISQYIICHFSGSLSSSVFSGIEKTGAYGLSIHPMFAFSNKYTSYRNFHTAHLTMEGHQDALAVMKPLFEGLGHKVCTIRAEDKMKYHAAAVMASNEMLGLMQVSLGLLEECGFGAEDAMSLLAPLVQENISSMLKKGCAISLTGPIERGDIQTVRGHLDALKGHWAEGIYRSLGQAVVDLAQEKNPRKNYDKIRKLFRNCRKITDPS